MSKLKVYDLPTRLFHWMFAGLFLGAFFIAKVIDDDSPTYPVHMLLGLVLGTVVLFRLVWGFVGSRYARFSSFALKPHELFEYFRQLITGKTARALGHNPASSWAALIMMTSALGLVTTGILMTTSNKDTFKEIHELFANTFILVVIAHVAGVILHTLRHKDWIGLSMVTGQKLAVEGQKEIERSHWTAAVLYLAIVGAFAFHLARNYDSNKQALFLFGQTLHLGETEENRQDLDHPDEQVEHEHDEH